MANIYGGRNENGREMNILICWYLLLLLFCPAAVVRLTKQPVIKVDVESLELDQIKGRNRILKIDNEEHYTDIKDLEDLGELGNGTSGQVIKMRHRKTNQIIAVKVGTLTSIAPFVIVAHYVPEAFVQRNFSNNSIFYSSACMLKNVVEIYSKCDEQITMKSPSAFGTISTLY